MRKLTSFLCILLLLSGCTDIVELELPEPKAQLVVNSTFTPDSAWAVEISASQSALTSMPYHMVQNAVVEIYQGSQKINSLQHIGNGKYKSTEVLPLPLQRYTIKANAPGYHSCTATDFVPSKPVITNFKLAAVRNVKDPQMAEVEASFILKDEPNAANYYYVNAYIQDTSHTGEPYKNYVSINFNAPFEEEFNVSSRYFFSDKFIDGQDAPLKVRYERPAKGKVLTLNVVQITPDYYTYSKTLEKQSYRDNFLTAPIPVHNNIKDGFGIFAGYNKSTYHIKH
ncbi:DUF4249 domain-containing protein [Pontibacter locisalis]|uniref:DUF4249 domain-containing protein n=1 Tax=Pontibacter locisalis TaxID=1719035 RepID=A0ABW5IN96_9BACT